MDLDTSNIKFLKDCSKDLILTLAVGYLGGVKKKIYTEDITVKAFEWNKIEFCWSLEKYSKYPDKEAARRPLLNARDKYGYISGAYARDLSKDGWRLTKKGLKIYNQLQHLLDKKPHLSKLNKKETASFKKSIKYKRLFKEFKKNPQIKISSYDLAEFLDSSPDNALSIRRNFYRMYTDLEFLEEPTIEKLFEELKKKFPKLLNENQFIQEQKVKERSRDV